MIRVTFDLLPGGREDRSRTIGVMEICNIGTRLDGCADYAVVMKKTPPFEGALRAAWRKGLVASTSNVVDQVIAGDEELVTALVQGHHRTKRGVYDLLYRAMKACGLDRRNPED